MRRSIQILFLMFLLVSCSGGNEASEEEKAAHTERERQEALAAVEEANKMVNILVREGKFEEAGKYFAPDVVQMISGQPPVQGRDAWIQAQRERQEALAAVEEANRMVNILVREGKFEEAGKYFAPDVVQMISGQPPVQGRAAWIQAQREAAELGDWNLELEVLDFEYMGDQAVERGRGVQTFTANEDSPIPSMKLIGDYLVLWEKTPEGWQIRYDYVVVAPPEMQEE